MPKYTDGQLDGHVMQAFTRHIGKGNPIGRWELVAWIFGAAAAVQQDDNNLADRQIRESIARLRKGGALICNLGDGRGMYLASNYDEYAEFRQYYGSAAFEKLEVIRALDSAAQEQFAEALQPRLL